MIDVSEKDFENTIEQALLGSGYRKRTSDNYDRALCLDSDCLIDFIQATQPKTWEKLQEQYGGNARSPFLKRVSAKIEKRGAVDVLRNGVKDRGCSFKLSYFKPVSGLNQELARLYEANQFSVVRQFHFSEKSEKSLDLGLFLNGIPIFTAELKNPLTGQNIQNAIWQYRNDRDPREPLFHFGRCLAHFAVDPDQVCVATHLNGKKTRFLPFNKGRDGGAGNPPSMTGFATAYLWDDAWSKDSVLNLIQHFIHQLEERVTNAKGRTRKAKKLIFPRYHQREAVNGLVADAREKGPGQRYLIQHSAGSGKSNSIAWLSHQLSSLHDEKDQQVFDSVIVVTDRRILDRQLQQTISDFQQVLGVVENIDQTSRQLADAIQSGKRIIVTTLQKFPMIDQEVRAMAGKRFALIIDEAHSSQSGESSQSVKKVLAGATLEEAAKAESGEPKTMEDRILAEMQARGPVPNVSMFAFTATPKQKTLELFGRPRADGKFEPFSLYSMRQAIEEGFILDVLENYTTYENQWKLLKTVEDNPNFEQQKTKRLLKAFIGLHQHTIGQKVEIMVSHFEEHVKHRIKGRAKAMIVTPSRLHAVRYALALKQYLQQIGADYKILVAFSDTIRDGCMDYTEANMNGFPEGQTAQAFNTDEYRFLVVANKFQTGFDQPLLYAMYVDKKLSGVGTVQTLSRLNRTHPDKEGTVVLDFANDTESILEDFQPYYERTLLSEGTDPNQLYDLQTQLDGFHLFGQADVDSFAEIWFDPKGKQEALHPILDAVVERFEELEEADQNAFRSTLREYTRLYGFLSQILTFADLDLEKHHVFARMLVRKLPVSREELPREVLDMVDMDSYRLRETSQGSIDLRRGAGELDPVGPGPGGGNEDFQEPLSQIIEELNERFGIDLTPADRVCLETALRALEQDPALDASVRVNPRDGAELTFKQKFEDEIQQFVESNFQLYKRITDDATFGAALRDQMFGQYLHTHQKASDLIKQGESTTLEYKSTLRWNLREERKDPKIVTHSVLKTIAAFLNTGGGDLLIGVADDGTLLGLDADRFKNNDKFQLHLIDVVRSALGPRASTCVDPRIQRVDGKQVCLVTCRRSPEPVWMKWKGTEKTENGDFFVRSGPGTVGLGQEDAEEFIKTRFAEPQ